MDGEYLWAAIRYVERNPVRAGIVERAEDYAWSSAAAHCDLKVDLLLARLPEGVVPKWSEWLKIEDAEQSKLIRRQALTGRPCGSGSFIAELERALNRVLRPQKRGPKSSTAGASARQMDLF